MEELSDRIIHVQSHLETRQITASEGGTDRADRMRVELIVEDKFGQLQETLKDDVIEEVLRQIKPRFDDQIDQRLQTFNLTLIPELKQMIAKQLKERISSL